MQFVALLTGLRLFASRGLLPAAAAAAAVVLPSALQGNVMWDVLRCCGCVEGGTNPPGVLLRPRGALLTWASQKGCSGAWPQRC